MLHWFERTDLNVILNLQDLTERRLVGALKALERFDVMAVQRSIFENTRAFLGLKTRGVVYDVTNTYFHGKCCLLGRLGHDKENRKGYPLIQIGLAVTAEEGDRKSTRLNSSHGYISYAVFCLKKKKPPHGESTRPRPPAGGEEIWTLPPPG